MFQPAFAIMVFGRGTSSPKLNRGGEILVDFSTSDNLAYYRTGNNFARARSYHYLL